MTGNPILHLVLDQGVPRDAASRFRELRYECTHVGEIGMGNAADAEILTWALKKGAVVVTLDADFHTILAVSGARPRVTACQSEVLLEWPNGPLKRAIRAELADIDKAVRRSSGPGQKNDARVQIPRPRRCFDGKGGRKLLRSNSGAGRCGPHVTLSLRKSDPNRSRALPRTRRARRRPREALRRPTSPVQTNSSGVQMVVPV